MLAVAGHWSEQNRIKSNWPHGCSQVFPHEALNWFLKHHSTWLIWRNKCYQPCTSIHCKNINCVVRYISVCIHWGKSWETWNNWPRPPNHFKEEYCKFLDSFFSLKTWRSVCIRNMVSFQGSILRRETQTWFHALRTPFLKFLII